ncbi:MAG TPA: cytochrome B [Gammaproteobacteria bacterium]|nr:cytochrome B [Gammaproteobacteria bacterium]
MTGKDIRRGREEKLLVWDLPTRVFHWLLVCAFALAWLTHDDNRFLYVHVYGGYALLGLLLFRLLWGAFGSHYARFHAFAYDWPSVSAYLKGLITGRAARHIGHNPAGAWAIFLMLVLGLAVSISGLLVLGGEEGHGPLAGLVSFPVGEASREVHELTAWFMLAMVALHLLGVAVESVIHRENLVMAMISGYKPGAPGARAAERRGLAALLLLGLAFASALAYFQGYLAETPDRPFLPFEGPRLPDNALWRSECGDCHLAYHPTLLPARSWAALLDGQADHFGEDLALDEETVAALRVFLTANAAESHLSEPAWKISLSVPAGEVPLRITETPYWIRKHRKIDQRYWKSEAVAGKGDCGACHLDAEAGTFEDSDMRLPDLTQVAE